MENDSTLRPGSENIADRIARLSPVKWALFQMKLWKTAPTVSDPQFIPRSETQESTPLSFAQQRLWILDQWEHDKPIYNIPLTLRFTGSCCVSALIQSMNEIISRHDVLRTICTVVDDIPAHRIIPELRLCPLPVDLEHIPEEKIRLELDRLVNEEARRPFNLQKDALLRINIFRLSEEEHVLMLVIHHIVADGWSLGVLLKELAVLYVAFSEGKPSPLSDLPIQYRDFAAWQRKRLQGGILETQLKYWKKQLQNAGVSELPLTRPRPAVQTYHGDSHHFLISQPLCEGLRSLSRCEDVTLFMTLLAALQTLLYRYSGHDDVTVGSPIANRNRVELEPLIGFFVNTLVLRTSLAGNPTFRDLLARVRNTALEAFAHQDLPFEKLVGELNPVRNTNSTPFFQVMFVLQNTPAVTPDFPGLHVQLDIVDTGTAKFDLTLYLTEKGGELQGKLEYSTDLFDRDFAENMSSHLLTLLDAVVKNPGERVSKLPILSEAGRRRLLMDWNKTRTMYPRDKCIHELFEQQVERTPEAVALVFKDRQLTYRELNGDANRLARHLRRRGIGPDMPVGICIERSIDQVAGILAILKAGGAYLPLDHELPKDRLSFMLEDAGVQVILTNKKLSKLLPVKGLQPVFMEDLVKTAGDFSDTNLDNETCATGLAYVMYTSGSTGTPKGVEIPHRGVIRLVSGAEYVDFGAHQTFLQLAPISFDASTFELWGALLHGARCVLYPGRIATPQQLGDIIRSEGVTTLWLTSSFFNLVIDSHPVMLSGLSQLLTGGEALSPHHVRKALELLPETRIYNCYGPTESTTFASCFPIPKEPDGMFTSVPIGHPIANTRIHILDRHLQPVPAGVKGELYIGGDGLARGYLNRPKLTGEMFIADPFSAEPGARLYRTGDLARYLPSGLIEFLGRRDGQVKIRGFRIETGEIEAALTGYPGVLSAMVIAREDIPGDKHLVAYLVVQQKNKISGGVLRHYLKKRLPAYMIPSDLVFLETIPLTANGKADLHALPPPRRSGSEGHLPPRDIVEIMLANIWRELLGIAEIGIHDNFFDCGGDSLGAVQMVAKIEKELGVRVPPGLLFEYATIDAVACMMRELTAEEYDSPLIRIHDGSPGRPLFFLHGDFTGGGYFCRALSRHLGNDLTFYAVQPFGLPGQPLPASIENMAEAYIAYILEIDPDGPYRLAGHCNGALVAMEIARRMLQRGKQTELLVLIDPSPLMFSRKKSEQGNASGAANKQVHTVAAIDDGSISNEDRRRMILELYFDICSNYVPAHFPGKLEIFAPAEKGTPSREIKRNWEKLANLVHIHSIPGDHFTIMTDHLENTAQRLRHCIDSIDPEPPPWR